VGVVGGESEIGLAPGYRLIGGIIGLGVDRVANNGAKKINLRAELDLDGLAKLELRRCFGLVALEGRVGGDERCARDGDRVSRAWRCMLA